MTNRRKIYTAEVDVTSRETWTVEADSEAEAREKFKRMDRDVDTDSAGGEVLDWDVMSVAEDGEVEE